MDNNENSNLTRLIPDVDEMSEEKVLEKFLFTQAKIELDVENQLEPPLRVWQEIERQTNGQSQSISHETRYPIKKVTAWGLSLAASVLLMSMGWLIWSNYHLQSQFEQVLVLNQQLEQQLAFSTLPQYQKTQLITQLNRLNILLIASETTGEKIEILKTRRNIIAQLIKRKQQGKEHEFSI